MLICFCLCGVGQQIKRGLLKHEVMELVFYIYTPKATGLPNNRQSTWLNPIIDGVEAKKLIGQSAILGSHLLINWFYMYFCNITEFIWVEIEQINY